MAFFCDFSTIAHNVICDYINLYSSQTKEGKMKKIHLAILLAASLNLANAYVIPTYHDGDPAPNGTTLLIPPYVSVYGSPLGVSSRMAARDDQLIPDGKSAIARSYTIHNYSSTPISGFKFYHYFNAPPFKALYGKSISILPRRPPHRSRSSNEARQHSATKHKNQKIVSRAVQS